MPRYRTRTANERVARGPGQGAAPTGQARGHPRCAAQPPQAALGTLVVVRSGRNPQPLSEKRFPAIDNDEPSPWQSGGCSPAGQTATLHDGTSDTTTSRQRGRRTNRHGKSSGCPPHRTSCSSIFRYGAVHKPRLHTFCTLEAPLHVRCKHRKWRLEHINGSSKLNGDRATRTVLQISATPLEHGHIALV